MLCISPAIQRPYIEIYRKFKEHTQLQDFALFYQFLNKKHFECGAYLVKKEWTAYVSES